MIMLMFQIDDNSDVIWITHEGKNLIKTIKSQLMDHLSN